MAFTLAMLIMAIGLVMVLSASGIAAEQSNGDVNIIFQASDNICFLGGIVLCGARP